MKIIEIKYQSYLILTMNWSTQPILQDAKDCKGATVRRIKGYVSWVNY